MAEIRSFMAEFSTQPLEALLIREDARFFSQASALNPELSPRQADCLYVVDSGLLRDLADPRPGLFLLTGERPELSADYPHTLLYAAGAEAPVLLRQVQQWLRRRQVYLEQSHLLLQKLLDSPPPQQLAALLDGAACIWQNPLLLTDHSGKLLAHSRSYYPQEAIWQQNIGKGFCAYEQLAELQQLLRQDNSAVEEGGPHRLRAHFSQTPLCLAKLLSPQDTGGYLLLLEEEPGPEVDPRLFRLVCRLAAQVSGGQQGKTGPGGASIEESVLQQCLAGELKSYASYIERVKNTNFASQGQYQLMIVNVDRFQQFHPGEDLLKTHLTRLFPKLWIVWHLDSLVVLVDLKQRKSVSRALEEQREALQELSLHFYISDVFSEVFHAAEFYNQALRTMFFAHKFHPNDVFNYYNKYKFYDLLSLSYPRDDLTKFYDSRLLDIIAYDRANHTQYLETVNAYILGSKSLNNAAAYLQVHKNTIANRLNKAKQLFGIDFDNINEVFRLMYSFKIKRLLESNLLDPDQE